MDEFEKWIDEYNKKLAHFGESYTLTQNETGLMDDAWQESAKQKDAEIDHLKTIIENLEMSVKSFTDSNVDLVARERKRIMEIIDSESYYAISARVKERIEKDSK